MKNTLILIIILSNTFLAIKSQTITVKDFLKVICSQNSSEQKIFRYSGEVYSSIPQEKQIHLFGIEVYNVAKCYKDANNNYYRSARELFYFVDQDKRIPINQWKNPWSNETLNVMHTASNPVQYLIGNSNQTIEVKGFSQYIFSADVNLFYHNNLSDNVTFQPYSPQKNIQTSQLTQIYFDANMIKSSYSTIPSSLSISMINQFYPWMKMGNTPGNLLIRGSGGSSTINELPYFIVRDIQEKLPLYFNAPECVIDLTNMDSWLYFSQNFDKWLSKTTFPLPAPQQKFPCKFQPVEFEKSNINIE